MGSPLFEKSEELHVKLFAATEQFPRRVRGTFTRWIEDDLGALDTALLRAVRRESSGNEEGWEAAVDEADESKALLARRVRLAHKLGFLTPGGYEELSGRVAEIGRLIGGWKRSRGFSG